MFQKKELFLLVGNNIKQFIFNIMKHLFTNELASTILFAGKNNNKIPFNTLKFHKLILGNMFVIW